MESHPLTLEPVPDPELVELLARVLRRGGGALSREAEGYLANQSAEHLANALAVAGCVVVRPVIATQGRLL